MPTCSHCPPCASCSAVLRDPADGGSTALTAMPYRIPSYFRSDDAAKHVVPGRHVVMSVDSTKLEQQQGDGTRRPVVVVRGKRFHAFGVQEVADYYAHRGSFHRHLYESLRTGTPYKPVMDLDRALDGSLELGNLQRVYRDVFLPTVVSFFGEALRATVTPACVRSLDASLEGKKFSKHLVLHIEDSGGAVWAYHDRAEEMRVMGAFRRHVEGLADRCPELASFYYFVEKGSVKTAVDYAIYHHGKRDMRIIGSCKAAGKRVGAPLRTLLPDPVVHGPAADFSFCDFLCNTFGAQTQPIQPPPEWTCAPAAKKRKRGTGRAQASSSAAAAPDTYVPVCETTRRLADLAVAAGAADCNKDDLATRVKAQGGGANAWAVPVNYGPGSDGDRRCLFMVPHSRHWAQLRCRFDETNPEVVIGVSYYCHGCGTSVPLYDGTQAAAATRRLLAPSKQTETMRLATEAGLVYQSVQHQFLPDIDMHSPEPETVILKSGMGSGKTSRIADYLQSLPETISVLCIGYRRVLNSALAAKFGLLDYQQADPSELPLARRVCVQVDSLPRLLAPNGAADEKALRAVFDVVIVDEVESTLDHFAGDTLDGKVLVCWKIFAIVLQRATKVILADADAHRRVFAVVAELRMGINTERVSVPRVIENTATGSSAAMCTCFVWMNSLSAFLERACDYLRRRKRVYVATNSRGFAHAFRSLVLARAGRGGEADRWLTDADTLLVDKDVPEHEKRRVRECNTTWLRYRLIICTPTVGAGIDFCVKDHIDATFVYATDKSTTPREINQQRGRVRCPSDKRCYMLVDTHYNAPVEEDAETLREALDQRSDVVVTDLVEHHHQGGEWMGVRLSKTPDLLLQLFALHEAEVNASRNNMRFALYRLLRAKYPEAEHVVLTDQVLGGEEQHARNQLHAEELVHKRERAERLLQQEPLTAEEQQALMTSVITGEDEEVPDAKLRLHMHSIRSFYPMITDWAITDIMTLGHPTYIARVQAAAVLLGGCGQATAAEWNPMRVSGAAQFSLAHRTALERQEPPYVTRAFFAMFAYFAGMDSTPAEAPTHSPATAVLFFREGVALHSELAEQRLAAHPNEFRRLEQKFGPMSDSNGAPCRKRVRVAFRKHVAAELGVRLQCAPKHKHLQAAPPHGHRGPEYCTRVRPDATEVAGLLAAVHASKPTEECGVLAASLLLQRPSLRQPNPLSCEVWGVGMSKAAPKVARKPTRALADSAASSLASASALEEDDNPWWMQAQRELRRVARISSTAADDC